MDALQPAQRIGDKFQNPVPTELGGISLMLKLLPQYLTNKAETDPRQPLGPFRTDPAAYLVPPAEGLRVTWFGHASLLLEIDGVTLLVDPVWDERASPVQWAGPKRFFAPTIPLADLPRVDAVVISHDHYDHLGAGTARQLSAGRPELRWITGLEVGRELRRMGVAANRITELDWTASTIIRGADGATLNLTALPARHFSGRTLSMRFKTLWSSFLFEGSRHRVYHGVDSGFWDGYYTIGQQYGPFDLTLLEIGAFNEMWKSIHLGPDGAARAFAALGGKGLLMPVHWALFNLALHAWRQPIERMTQLADEQGIPLFSPLPGEPTDVLAGQIVRSDWWRA